MTEKEEDERTTAPTTRVSDDPDVLAAQAREAIDKSAQELRRQRVPIATEPPTVYRP
ncbi:MAG TPA: hypothetical protein VFC31_06165 [Candidatus Limnocylindria bacterium]|nr:hypothetical protein [Candidatus Limnocylindria bacterium]